MHYAKVYIDKASLKSMLGISNDIALAITRLELNPDDGIDITFVVDSEIEGITTTNDDGNIRRRRLARYGNIK